MIGIWISKSIVLNMPTSCSLTPGFLRSPPASPTLPYLSSYSARYWESVRCRIYDEKAGKRRIFGCGICCRVKAAALHSSPQETEEEKEEFQVLASFQTCFNNIVILDTPKSRLLLLDSTHNVHSILNKDSKWTASYWDEFAALPPVVPPGPIAIFGLGGGTAAHLLLDLWPSLQLEGWEIDEFLIDMSREYFGLSDLEKKNMDGGVLNVHMGDVFSPSVKIPGGYAGIIVDLFGNGKVLPQLEEASTWLELYGRLMPNGRFMVNCGAGESGIPNDSGDACIPNATIQALCKSFPGQVHWKKLSKKAGENYMALTGLLPDLAAWSGCLPPELGSSVGQWKTCNDHDNAYDIG